jgi:hypothetical protein
MTPARLPSGGAGVLAFGMPRPFRRTAALVAGLCLLPAVAWGEARVQVLEIDPATPAELGKWEQFYVRVAYDTDRPAYVRGAAFLDGKPVPSMTSGSMRHEAGAGEVFFWFAYTTPARVDLIVMTAHDAATNKAIAQTAIAVDLRWTGAPVGSARPRPDWVVRMQVEQDHRVKEQSDAYVNRSTPWWATLLFFGLMWSAPAYFVLQAVALWRWDGGWRTAAMIPLLPMAAVLLYTIVAYRAGSNLFPLVLIFSSPPALLYLVVLMILRRRRLQAA